jgi:hypothetical protein
MQELEKLESVQLDVQLEKENANRTIATLKNNSNETAFFNRLKIVEKEGGTLALPVFLSDNYITLFPGEQKKIEIDLSQLPASQRNENLQLVLDPWKGEVVKRDL